MTLTLQLTLSLAYTAGIAATFGYLHSLTVSEDGQRDLERLLIPTNHVYVIWALLSLFWPATWAFTLVEYFQTNRHIDNFLKPTCRYARLQRCQPLYGSVVNNCCRYAYGQCVVHQRSRACRCLRCTRNFPLPERNELGEWESKEEYEMRTGLKLPGSSDEQ